MNNQDKKEERLPINTLIKNTFYILKYAMKHSPGTIVFIMICLEIINQAVAEGTQIKLVKVSGQIQRELIEKSSHMDLLCYDTPDYYEDLILAAAKSDTMIQKCVLCIANIIGNILGMITAATVVMTINPIIAIFPVAGFIVNLLTRFRITKLEFDYDMAQKKAMLKADYSKRVFYEPIYAKEMKLTDIANPLKRQFRQAAQENIAAAHTYGVKIAILSLVNWISVFTILSFFCVPVTLGYFALVLRQIALGDVAAMNNAANIIRRYLDRTNFALVDFQQVGQYAERFRRFIDAKANIEETIGEKDVPEGGALVLDNVSFAYPNTDKATLKHISMSIKPGEKIAIVGENGAGKSTFVKLLMRLYDVTEGKISYGDIDIREFTTKEYRHRIATVFQDYQMYGGTVAENVLMGPCKTKEDEKKVLYALKLADFEDRLEKMPEGIYTELTREFSEHGTTLSGGQAQKVAIARLFARKIPFQLAILDEQSSALDPVAEYKLNQNMMENAGEAAVIFISHRLSTTRKADRIYLFENGEIKEQGTHDELMALNGEYRKMFDRQAKYYRLDLQK